MSMATGGRSFSLATKGMSLSASGGPSIRMASGCWSSKAFIRALAEPGPWWRMP